MSDTRQNMKFKITSNSVTDNDTDFNFSRSSLRYVESYQLQKYCKQ